MKDKLQIQSVMHPFPHTIGAGQSLKTARVLMQEHGVRHLPVQDGGQLTGILTERDIHFAVAIDKKDPEQILVRDAATADPYVIPPTEPVAKVARRMAHDHIGCALIVENHKLLGIFTTVDACRTLAEVLSGVVDQ